MKVLTLSTSDTSGGAARAAYNLYKSLSKTGIYSKMLVLIKGSTDHDVIGKPTKFKKLKARLALHLDSFHGMLLHCASHCS